MWMLLTEPSYKRTLLGVRLASEESKPEDITEAITSSARSIAQLEHVLETVLGIDVLACAHEAQLTDDRE
jgi:hypothetical protein